MWASCAYAYFNIQFPTYVVYAVLLPVSIFKIHDTCTYQQHDLIIKTFWLQELYWFSFLQVSNQSNYYCDILLWLTKAILKIITIISHILITSKKNMTTATSAIPYDANVLCFLYLLCYISKTMNLKIF